MAGEWRDTTLREAVTFFAGGDSFLKLEYTSIGIPVLAKGDVKPFGRVVHGGDRFMPQSLVAERGYRITKPGDYLLTTRDLTQDADFLGLLAPIPSDNQFLVNQGANIVRFCPEFDGRYLAYWCNGPAYRAYIKGHYVGSTQIHLRKDDFLDAPLLAPSLAEQKAIAAVLGALDDKIELNRRMNATLEAMARALFQSWFVDFDPVRAKLDGRQPPGLDPATAALFPDHFDHDADGAVPKGWSRKRWGDIARLQYGKSLRDYRESGGKYRVFGTNGPIGFHDEALCKSAGIVIGRKGAYRGVHYSPDPFFVIDTAFYLEPKVPFDLKWAYYELLRFDINSMDSGSAIPSTSRDDFYGIPVLISPAEIQDAFGKIVSGWFAKVFANDQESRALATLRDMLLPKLLSGEVIVEAKR